MYSNVTGWVSPSQYRIIYAASALDGAFHWSTYKLKLKPVETDIGNYIIKFLTPSADTETKQRR